MKILSQWLRSYLPTFNITDRQLADDLTLRGIAVEGVFDLYTTMAVSTTVLCLTWTSPPTASMP